MKTPADKILFLQRTIGNQAVQRLIKSGTLQAKLRIGQPEDKYEQEADRVADAVMRMPEPGVQRQVEPEEEEEETLQPKPLASQITPLLQVQRQEEPEEEEETLQAKPLAEEITPLVQRQVEPEEEEEELQAKATSGRISEVNSNLGSQIQSLKGGGQPLSENDRTFFEPRFGRDFSKVRVHSSGAAEQSAREVNASAYTVGRDIVFGAGQFQPHTPNGQQLLAHELVHTVQQSSSGERLQRLVDCEPTQMFPTPSCQPRKRNEAQREKRRRMMTLEIVPPAQGLLVFNFDIGKTTIKSGLQDDPNWQRYVGLMKANPNRRYKILGFTDCHGDKTVNMELRKQRAEAIKNALPVLLNMPTTEVPSLTDCITKNLNEEQRAFNRSALIQLVESTYEFTGDTIKGDLERDEPDTEGCSENQRKRLAIAFPLARRMGENAKAAISRMKRGSPNEALLQKFFGSRAFNRRWRIDQGYHATLRAITGGPTYKCVPQGTDPCDSLTTSGYVGAHAIIFGNPIVVCDSGFNADNIEIADTILHEASHVGDLTNDLEYCSRSSGCSLDTTDEHLPGIRLTDRGALNNAASYARFASELFRLQR